MDKLQIKHIFFDLDNTLWDHRGNSQVTLQKMFEEYSIESKYKISFDQWHPVFYDSNELLWEQIREGQIQKSELRERRFRDPFLHFDIHDIHLAEEWEKIYLERMGRMSGTVEGAYELLSYLSPTYTLHVITNGFIEVSQSKIENSVLKGFFHTLTCADELNLRKPDPRLFELALKKAGCSKHEALIIGDDWIADIIGGLGAGWQAVFYDALSHDNQIPDVPCVKNLLEIKDLL